MREQAKMPESSFQRAYLRQKKREREQVRVFRALLLVSFLVLWEVAADLRWIRLSFPALCGWEKRS